MMKKLVCLIFAFVLCLSLSACGTVKESAVTAADQEKSTAEEDVITSDTSPHAIDALYFENEEGARLYLGQPVEDCEAILGTAESSSERDKVSVTVSGTSIEKASFCIYKDAVVIYANGQAIAILLETKNLDNTTSWCLNGHPYSPVLNESISNIPEEYYRTSYVSVDDSFQLIGEDTVMENLSIYGPDNLISCYIDYEDDRITNVRIGTYTGLTVMA